MAELMLHFEASADTDLAAAAAALQSNLAETVGVESAATFPQKYQSIGPAEVLGVIQVATDVVKDSALFLTAVAGLLTAWEKVKVHFPGLGAPKLEVGLKEVPASQVTQEHQEELASEYE
ncbi:MAG TPA: hypothetical protein VG168_08375 [Bryobacteraceae bacterium]|nr:hypothetical protein [Bryobacteraceae bacterium]